METTIPACIIVYRFWPEFLGGVTASLGMAVIPSILLYLWWRRIGH